MVNISLGERTYNLQEDYFYIPSHQWVKEDQGMLIVGITDVAVQQLGEISFVELMPHTFLHAKVDAIQFNYTPHQTHISSEPIPDICIEGQKTVFNLYSPCSGAILQINEVLQNQPELINEDPYQRGWLFYIRPSDWDHEKTQLWTLSMYITYLQQLHTASS